MTRNGHPGENREGLLPIDRFESDKRKNAANVVKHDIDFADALQVFSDPNAVTFESKHKSNEVRYLIVGRMHASLITVVFTLSEARIRIISARPAGLSERKRYGQ